MQSFLSQYEWRRTQCQVFCSKTSVSEWIVIATPPRHTLMASLQNSVFQLVFQNLNLATKSLEPALHTHTHEMGTFRKREKIFCFVNWYLHPSISSPLHRKMVKKSLVAGLVVLLVAAMGFFLGVFLGVGNKQPTGPSDHFYSKAAVAADAGKCSEIGRWEEEFCVVKGKKIIQFYLIA